MYAQILAPNAHVIDDCYVYCRAPERYLFVVNASNDDKDWAWFNAVLRGEVLVDLDRPWAKVPGRAGVNLRDLRDPASGADQRVDIALQGPKARDILLALGADAATTKAVKALKRTQLCDAVIGGFDLIVARTGYTGEVMGFELFVHPDRAVDLWNALLAAGEPMGAKPAGLAARDSLRTEAGLPLYGEEMAGVLDLGVGDAGFDSYVKTHKPWFIGRKDFLEQEKKRKAEVVRFRFAKKAGRMAHYLDPVVDEAGRVIGHVTSCSIDTEGYRLGQAYLEHKYTAEGTPVYVFQSASDKPEKPRKSLKAGEKIAMPEAAAVLSRFPKRK
jgi:glycine hydroxymethyltransferase